ncbi:hypothetical protein R82291_FJPPFKPJ_01548 [Fructobacillus cardui]|nr:hypothetical protein R82291_FJPPFKPJ_01548 [Fructobacillus cardui]
MNRLEQYIDKFPDYKFYGIEVPDNRFFGQCVRSNDEINIFINTLQPEEKQIQTLLHEVGHANFNLFSNSDKRWCRETMRVEKYASQFVNHYEPEY